MARKEDNTDAGSCSTLRPSDAGNGETEEKSEILKPDTGAQDSEDPTSQPRRTYGDEQTRGAGCWQDINEEARVPFPPT